MDTKKEKTQEWKSVRLSAIAEKYGCSIGYVYKILNNKREQKSVLAQKIIKDTSDMIDIINRDTTITV